MPLLLIAVARDKDESSTDPWLSFTVFSHCKFLAESFCWNTSRKEAGESGHVLAGVQLPQLMLWLAPQSSVIRHSSVMLPLCPKAVAGRCGALGLVYSGVKNSHDLLTAHHTRRQDRGGSIMEPRLVLKISFEPSMVYTFNSSI